MKKLLAIIISTLLTVLCGCNSNTEVSQMSTSAPTNISQHDLTNSNSSELTTNKVYMVPCKISEFNSEGILLYGIQTVWDFQNNKLTYSLTSNGEYLDDNKYTYNVSVTDTGRISEISYNNTKCLFEYDSNDRLIESADNDSVLKVNYTDNYNNAEVIDSSNNYNNYKYVFDDFGNIISKSNDSYSCNVTYDEYNNRIGYTVNGKTSMKKTELSYDDNCNLTGYSMGDSDVYIKYNASNYAEEICYNDVVFKIEYIEVTKTQYESILELRLSKFAGYFDMIIDDYSLFAFYDFFKPAL